MAGGKGVDSSGSETKDGGVVIQRVVHVVGGETAFPVLTKSNYTEWAMLMKVKLKARGLWVTVEKGEADPQEDTMALDALVSSVPPEMVATVAKKKTAKEAWDAIATMHVGDDRVKKASTQQLRSQFDRAAFKEGESIEDFILRLNRMVATLATLGKTVEEHVVVEKVLRCVPLRLKQIALAISTLLDVRTLTVANLAGRLKMAEEAFEDPPPSLQQDGKLYLTEEEWNSRWVRHETERQGSGSAGGSGSSGNGSGRGGGSDHGRGQGRGRGRSFAGRGPHKTDECRRCGKLGH
jgi:uncharacterized membrane protein YgcG